MNSTRVPTLFYSPAQHLDDLFVHLFDEEGLPSRLDLLEKTLDFIPTIPCQDHFLVFSIPRVRMSVLPSSKRCFDLALRQHLWPRLVPFQQFSARMQLQHPGHRPFDVFTLQLLKAYPPASFMEIRLISDEDTKCIPVSLWDDQHAHCVSSTW